MGPRNPCKRDWADKHRTCCVIHYTPSHPDSEPQARTALSAILRQIPHDLNVLEELRPILIEGNKIDVCASLHQDAFEHYQELYPTGVGVDPDVGQEIPGGGFDLMHILVLADSYNSIKKYHNAITTIRRGSRWLQGRGSQPYWDACEDDREFDVIGSTVVRSGTVAPGMYELDINARHRLAVSRIKMGDIEEGQVWFSGSHSHSLLTIAQDARECNFSAGYSRICTTVFRDRGRVLRPEDVYDSCSNLRRAWPRSCCMSFPSSPPRFTHQSLEQTSSIYVLERAAACRRMNGDLENSAAIYEQGSVSVPVCATCAC